MSSDKLKNHNDTVSKNVPAEDLLTLSFGLSVEERNLLKQYQLENGYKNISVTVRKILNDAIKAKLKIRER